MLPISSVGLDLDEVISNLNDTAIERLNAKYGTCYVRSDIQDYNWHQSLFGLEIGKFLDDLIEMRVLEDALPLDGTPEAVRSLLNAGIHVRIVTSRGFHPRARAITEKWLSKHGVPYNRLEIVGAGRKKSEYFEHPVDLFVDDHLENHRDMIDTGLSRRNVVIANSWNDPNRNNISRFRRRLDYAPSLAGVVLDIIEKAA